MMRLGSLLLVTCVVSLSACGPDAATTPSDDTDEAGTTSLEESTSSTSSTASTAPDADSSSAGTTAGSSSTSDTVGSGTGPAEPLDPNPGESRYALVGETVTLDGSGSMGAVRYQWNFDDGSSPAEPSEEPVAQVTYETPGRYRPILTVFDAAGNVLSENVTITVTLEPTHAPNHSSSIALTADDTAVVVSPDSGEIVTIERRGDEFALGQRIAVCETRNRAAW